MRRYRNKYFGITIKKYLNRSWGEIVILSYGVEYGIFSTFWKCTRTLEVSSVKRKAVHNEIADLMGWYWCFMSLE